MSIVDILNGFRDLAEELFNDRKFELDKYRELRGFMQGVEKQTIKIFAETLKDKYSQADILCPRRIICLTENQLNELVEELENKL